MLFNFFRKCQNTKSNKISLKNLRETDLEKYIKNENDYIKEYGEIPHYYLFNMIKYHVTVKYLVIDEWIKLNYLMHKYPHISLDVADYLQTYLQTYLAGLNNGLQRQYFKDMKKDLIFIRSLIKRIKDEKLIAFLLGKNKLVKGSGDHGITCLIYNFL